MTAKTKREYSVITAERYRDAKGRKEKIKILDEFCATTCCHRKHGIRKLRRISFHEGPPPAGAGKSSILRKRTLCL